MVVFGATGEGSGSPVSSLGDQAALALASQSPRLIPMKEKSSCYSRLRADERLAFVAQVTEFSGGPSHVVSGH